MNNKAYQQGYRDAMRNFRKKSNIDVLDRIIADIENDWQLKEYPSSPFSCGLRRALEIIDRYKAESEE